MPELPDIVNYLASLQRLLQGAEIQKVVVRSPFVVRTFEPSIDSLCKLRIQAFSRRGKRIVWHLSEDNFLVFHLMIAGRFHWFQGIKAPTAKMDLLAIQTDRGTLKLTEASSKKRAGLWLFSSLSEVDKTDPGGLDVLANSLAQFKQRLLAENRTLKRCLTDPRKFDGIGNAYSDEILQAARLSPLRTTHQLSELEIENLFNATCQVLRHWIDRLAQQTQGFPEKVTAFHPEMKVHGKFGSRCPNCGSPIQRIRYADNECNYCPGCQTAGKILADRSLSRLLKDEWPRTLEELDQ
jgi:formamidopyrimidine-DNA glycosylase